jgi:arginyl-tRNA synthetase
MQKILKNIIQKGISNLWSEQKIAPADISISYPPDQFGDYSCNIALQLAARLKLKPQEVADQLKRQIEETQDFKKYFSRVDVAGPGFLNFYFSSDYLHATVKKIIEEKETYGKDDSGAKVMVEYSQPNTHKEFHVGHLRNVILGSTLVNVLRKAGYAVTAANYIGDTGSHVAKCMWGLKKFHAEVDWDKVENKAEFLGKVYSEAVQQIADNKQYEAEFKALQNDFERGNSELVRLWQQTRQFCLDDFKQLYTMLGVVFDVYFFESEEELVGKQMLGELLKNKLIKQSEGAVIADLNEAGLGVLVLQRKDGAALYGLKDIPLAIKKFKEYDIEKSIYIVDVRQSLYFQQIFTILRAMGFQEELVHIGYDFVTLKGGEGMSSRKGNVVPAREFLEKMKAEVALKFPNAPRPEEISLGAVKFFMLKHSSRTIVEFDMEESISLSGATGPYVQYAHARIASILRKAEKMGTEFFGAGINLLKEEKELAVIRHLARFPELIAELAQSYEVHKLPYYAIELADKFHSFYHACKVLDEHAPELTASRLELVQAAKIVLAETLRLMGVSAPEKM